MAQRSVRQLIDLLPSETHPLPLSEGAALDLGVALRVDDGDLYVPPELRWTDGVAPEDARVVLLSAPAAVGKTALAEYVARQTRSPLWDLGAQTLGSSSFIGAISRLYGIEGQAEFLRALSDGEATLILDGADEGLVRAGVEGFDQALADLARLVPRVDGPAVVVVLGRPDTIAHCFVALDDAGLAVSVVTVGFFDQVNARKFVHLKSGSTVPDELDAFLSRFFDNTMRALGVERWEEAEEFLGYSPVLDALATFADDEPNPFAKFQRLSQQATTTHVWSLLAEIVESVLHRETEKFEKTFGQLDPHRTDLASSGYSSENQVRLLLAPDIHATLEERVVASDPSEQQELRSKIADLFEQHPFRRDSQRRAGNVLERFVSVAMRDFVVASAIALCDEELSTEVTIAWRSMEASSTPMLSRFLFGGLAPDRVDEWTLSLIVDSHASDFVDTVFMQIGSVEDDRGEEIIEALLIEQGAPVGVVRVGVLTSGRLEIDRAIARTSIDLDNGVLVLGLGRHSFALGPDVSIEAREVHSESVEVQIGASPGSLVTIDATTISGRTSLIHDPSRSMRIIEGHVRYPWTQSVAAAGGRDPSEEGLRLKAAMGFRRNFKWFVRDWRTQALTYPADNMQRILGRNRASREWHDFLIEEGLLWQEGDWLMMSLPDGVSSNAVFRMQLENLGLVGLIDRFLDWRSQA